MSDFSDKLMRLHSSRVRATELTADGEEQRVFVAEPEPEPEPNPEPEPKPLERQPVTKPTSPERQAIRDQLLLGERLGQRPTSRAPAKTASKGAAYANRRPSAPSYAHTPIGTRLGDLRREADAIIGTGDLEPALALLHEMVALSPSHPWALKHLAAYWGARDEQQLATLYADRLAAVAPY